MFKGSTAINWKGNKNFKHAMKKIDKNIKNKVKLMFGNWTWKQLEFETENTILFVKEERKGGKEERKKERGKEGKGRERRKEEGRKETVKTSRMRRL